jgi:DoxX-like family
MKKTNILNWIFTGLLALGMLFSALPDLRVVPEAIDIITTHLGYPKYIIVFLGAAKLLGVIAILVPGFPRLKEWAYAGFTFDLAGAMYSSISVGDPAKDWMMLFIGFAIIFLSYFFYHKKRNQKLAAARQ